jgi:hypothetical protein
MLSVAVSRKKGFGVTRNPGERKTCDAQVLAVQAAMRLTVPDEVEASCRDRRFPVRPRTRPMLDDRLHERTPRPARLEISGGPEDG